MISLDDFNAILRRLRALGWADGDIEWSESCAPPADAEEFAREAEMGRIQGAFRAD